MSDGPHSDLRGIESETEEIDAIAVPAGEGPLPAPASDGLSPAAAPAFRPQALALLRSAPAVQVAAVAAGGFVAGAAVLGLARRKQAGSAHGRRGRRASKAREGRRGIGLGGGELLHIVGSRSLLLDVHLLDAGAARRGRR